MNGDSLLSRNWRAVWQRPAWGATLALPALFTIGCLGCGREAHGPVTQADIPAEISPELRALIEATFSADPKTRADGAEKLGEMGERAGPAAPFVIRLLDDETDLNGPTFLWQEITSVSSIARVAIAKMGAPAIDLLLLQITDLSAETRFSAVWGFECCTDSRIVMPLIDRFKDRDAGVHFIAVDHFCKHRDPRVVGPLLGMLNDDDTSVRRSAINALGQQGDRRAAAPLLKIFWQTTDDDRDAAAYALGRIDDPVGLEALVATLNNRRETPRMRMSAAGALGNAPDCGPAALDSLTRILQDSDEIPALRGTVARALASIQGTKVVPLLSEMARRPSENDQVRFWAAMSVIQEVDGAIDDPLLLIPLQNGYVDLQVRLNLCELGQLAEDTENALAKVAKQGKTPAVRLAASQVLAEFRQQRGKQPDDEKPHDPSGGQDAP